MSLRFVQNVLYKLTQRYGLPITVYRSSTSVDDEGVSTETLTKVTIKRALVLEALNTLKSAHDITAMLKQSLYDVADRRFIIDRKTLGDFVITPTNCYIVYKNRKFEVKEAIEIENTSCYSVLTRETKDEVFNQVFDFRITHVLAIRQEESDDQS